MFVSITLDDVKKENPKIENHTNDTIYTLKPNADLFLVKK